MEYFIVLFRKNEKVVCILYKRYVIMKYRKGTLYVCSK